MKPTIVAHPDGSRTALWLDDQSRLWCRRGLHCYQPTTASFWKAFAVLRDAASAREGEAALVEHPRRRPRVDLLDTLAVAVLVVGAVVGLWGGHTLVTAWGLLGLAAFAWGRT